MFKFALCVVAVLAAASVALASNNLARNTNQRFRKPVNAKAVHIPDYFIAAAGSGAQPINNTRLLNIYDIQSQEFIDFFNFNKGLPYYQASTMAGCCTFMVASVVSGTPVYLTLRKNITDPSTQCYTAPYTASGQHECAETLPATGNMLGGIEGVGFCEGQFFGMLNLDLVSRLAEEATLSTAVGCPQTTQAFGFYASVKPKPKFVGGASGNHPAGYNVATIADLQSEEFANEINSKRVKYLNSEQMAGCCILKVADGFVVNTAGSYLSFYTSAGTFDCSSDPSSPIALGYAASCGSDALKSVPRVTKEIQSTWKTVAQAGSCLGCGTVTESFTMYKAK